MADKDEQTSGPDSLLEAWTEASREFWAASLRAWPANISPQQGEKPSDSNSKSRSQESWETAMRTFQAFTSVMGDPGVLESTASGINKVPEVVLKVLKPAWEGFFQLQRDWLERAARIGKSTEAYDFGNLDQEAFKAWTEIYEKEFRQFLKIPQIGLTRAYQERMSEATDKFNIFQATVAEFLSVLYLPLEKSNKVIQEKLAAMAEDGSLPETSRDYYRMWIKVLEGHYMTLFKSPEYNQELAKTLDALSDFLIARQKTIEDGLRMLPIPTQKEMDELYYEIYLLKKRLKSLEKKTGIRFDLET